MQKIIAIAILAIIAAGIPSFSFVNAAKNKIDRIASQSDTPIIGADNKGSDSGSSNNNNNNNDNNNSSSGGSNTGTRSSSGTIGGEAPPSAKNMVVTAILKKGEITKGGSETITVKALSENGTGISDVNVAATVVDYATQQQRVLLGGQTDKTGEVDLTTQIGPNAHLGQYLVAISAEKDGQKSTISTGFAVNDKAGMGSDGKKGQ
jgi:hypothetical protein